MDFDFKIYDENYYNKFLKHLKSLSKNESVEDKKRHISILNTKQDVLSISMSEIRKTAKQIYKNGYEYFLKKGLKTSYLDEFYEETLIQGLVIAEIKDLNLQIEFFKEWILKIDNWSTCDSTVTSLKNLKKCKNKQKYFNFYYNLCFFSEEFVARFGIIVLMSCFLEDEFIDKILDMCKVVKSDKYYINMGLAWLVSEAFVKYKDKTLRLLKEKTLSKFVQNKAICKCRDSYRVSNSDKESLVKYRIK